MTAPFLSLAQILNRLVLTTRWILRDHRPGPDGRCPICRRAGGCPVATAAHDVLRKAREVQRWNAASDRTTADPDDPRQGR
ncbi:MAG TPA: hypothetical protein VGD43_08375 [Micromonospora sp.]